MPGLSQLKQFNKDILSLGDELTLRANRSEQPVKVDIPKSIKDVNDSEDFVLGMPEVEADVVETPIDDDLSDLTGIISSDKSDKKEQSPSQPAFQAPDLSSILSPIDSPSVEETQDIPDLSQFMEPEEVVPEEPAEPEEVSIADMGLDALLSGSGFDGSDGSEIQEESESEEEPAEDFINDGNEQKVSELEDDIHNLEKKEESEEKQKISGDALSLDEIGLDNDDLDDVDEISEADEIEDAEEPAEIEEHESLKEQEKPEIDGLDSFEEESEDLKDENKDENKNESDSEISDLDDIPDFEEPESINETDSADNSQETNSDTSVDDNFDLPDDLGDFNIPDAPDNFENTDDSTASGLEDENGIPQGLFNIDDLDSTDDDKSNEPIDDEKNVSEDSSNNDDFNLDDIPDFTENVESESSTENIDGNSNKSDNLDDLGDLGDFNLDNIGSASVKNEGNSDSNGLATPDLEIPDFDDETNLDSGESGDGLESTEPLEVFDTTGMEDVDFGIPETDSKLSDSETDFELGKEDEFPMEGSDFEIPGFSDVSTAKEEKKSTVLKSSKDKEKKENDKKLEELPPNTLTDEQYKTFLKNLNDYPLNVRLAFEDLIVKDEFTDDAEFEIIEKILNKAPTRQVASLLEKMLDITIPVPRDFEHRTAAEYEAYKKSLQYQLRNKIIPGILIGILLILVGIALFSFSKNCIYTPIKANSLYKQGYVLLQSDEYTQSEMKFNEAVKYRLSKKWFFNYARGYREHKQYQRSEKMYSNILKAFNHDKTAGLEYAKMEMDDLSNYEKAEEILRREVLDYHINDKDGILMLGDNYLEWGTEKDNEKMELAREQYATLIQLYKPNNLYLSRMMRYFIRTNNLREVLQVESNFQKDDSLSSEDWTELSGFLFDKYYGELAPSDEYLRYEIDGLRRKLMTAVRTNPKNPTALYNLSKYFIKTDENDRIESTLQNAIDMYNKADKLKPRDIYKYIDSFKLLGENYVKKQDYLKAQEQYTEGLSLYNIEKDNAGFKGSKDVGELYSDLADINYFISGNYDDAFDNYTNAIELNYDNPSIRYRIGYMQYKNKNYSEALGSFMKAGEGNIKEKNLMLSMANTLTQRNDYYASEGYYGKLIDYLDEEIASKGIVFPQVNKDDYDLVQTYLHAANNYGVTLYRLAKRTGNSGLNAEAVVQLSQSVRAWDALTRNQETMVRLEGSNLAAENIKYISNPVSSFEPTIYTEIPKVLKKSENINNQ